jgi:hypothetical protein
MKVCTGLDLGGNILEALGITQPCLSLRIEIEGNDVVVVTTKSLVTEESGKKLGELLQHYEVYPIHSEFEPEWDLIQFCQTGNGYKKLPQPGDEGTAAA